MKCNVKSKLFAVVLSVCFVLNCRADNQAGSIAPAPSTVKLIDPDYRLKGSGRIIAIEGHLKSSTGCKVNYTRFKPHTTESAFIVVLGHGFLRSQKRMKTMARHFASWGIDTVTVEFCNSKPWAGNHDKNGADMVSVSQQFQAAGTIYLGFSAGGLAALVASKIDPGTQAYFGLDLVDHRNLGETTAPQLSLPLYGLLAAPSACNADGNGLDVYAEASRSVIIKVTDATHCHFEIPIDAKCSLICGRGEKRYSRQEIQQTILGLTTAFLLWQTGIDPTASNWWSVDGHNFKAMVEAGYIIPVERE